MSPFCPAHHEAFPLIVQAISCEGVRKGKRNEGIEEGMDWQNEIFEWLVLHFLNMNSFQFSNSKHWGSAIVIWAKAFSENMKGRAFPMRKHPSFLAHLRLIIKNEFVVTHIKTMNIHLK